MSLLKVDDLTVYYAGEQSPALKGASFELDHGRTLGVVGESGSGKTTVALALGGLLPSGAKMKASRIELGGHDLLDISKRKWLHLRRSEVAFVFQSPVDSWNPTRVLRVQVKDALQAAGRSDDYSRLVSVLQRVGIDDPDRALGSYPHQLSGGMLQRISIAVALVHEPALLIADEPTSALDSTVQAEILEILHELRTEANLSLVIISHDLSVVSRLADEVVVMYGGRVVERGETEDVLGLPVHPYTRGLLASVPKLEGETRTPLPAMAFGEIADQGCVFATRCDLREETCLRTDPLPIEHKSGFVACGPGMEKWSKERS
ncbi:MAG: hypothetical protein CL467_02445 [Acidimicrobiaceae bacterium]|nr:hypothetical protein [Acidimicrobiaceae bacterium]|tara:strand:- start:11569 stop:12525 length:957 start_codon:yes stop_codon:yes gene_type:complete